MQGMQALGWTEGRNLSIENRFPDDVNRIDGNGPDEKSRSLPIAGRTAPRRPVMG